MSEEKLPKGWKSLKIGELSDQINGKAFKPSDWSTSGIPIIRIQNLNNPKAEFNYAKAEIEEKYHVKNGDLLFAWSGTPGTSFGAHIWERGNAYLNQHIFNIKITSDKIDRRFYYYAFKIAVEKFIIQAQGTAGLAHITKGKFENTEIPVPPLPEQKRIVAKLDAAFGHLDSLREKLDRIPELLKNLRQQVLTQAVTGELTREWRTGKDLGEWEETTIGDLFEVKTGGTPRRGVKEYYEGGTIPWVKSGLVKNELIFEADEFITELAIKDSNVKIFPIDTLLVAMYGEGKTRGQVGWLKIEATTNQAIAALVNEDMPNITRTYVYYYCLSQYNDIRAKAEGGNQPNLNLSKIKEWEISIPPTDEQIEIVSRIDALFELSDKIESQYQSLKAKIDQLPQAVLAKAFRGELVGQEVKEYVREVGELGMVAERLEGYSKQKD